MNICQDTIKALCKATCMRQHAMADMQADLDPTCMSQDLANRKQGVLWRGDQVGLSRPWRAARDGCASQVRRRPCMNLQNLLDVFTSDHARLHAAMSAPWRSLAGTESWTMWSLHWTSMSCRRAPGNHSGVGAQWGSLRGIESCLQWRAL